MRAIRTTTISILALGLLAGSAVGVAAQDEEAMAVSSFHGSLVEQTEGSLNMVIEMSDPRASGELRFAEAWTELGSEDGLNRVNWSPMSVRLVNENGSWSGTKMDVGTTWGGTAASDWLLTGEDGYEGLTMMLGGGSQDDDFWGAIVPTDAIPPFPEPPAE